MSHFVEDGKKERRMKEFETAIKHPLVTSQLLARSVFDRLRSSGFRIAREQSDKERFRPHLERIIRNAPFGLIKAYAFFYLPGNKPPWVDTGLYLNPGERVSIVASGRVFLSKIVDIWVEPRVQLWLRIGDKGEIFRGTENTNTFTVGDGGRLYFGNFLPAGDWADRTGKPAVSESEYRSVKGGTSILVIRRIADPYEGLKRLVTIGDYRDLLMTEIDRLTNPIHEPEGWTPLWSVGPNEIFQRVCDDGNREIISCNTCRTVGIIQKSANAPLTPHTHICWEWKVDTLPSRFAEHTIPSHDYMSIGVEFDNGRDITYYWSAALPPETFYRCPFPTWTDRETHVVVRSGKQRLGEWIREERNLFNDYRKAIGPPPQKIVRVWLLATTLFQRRRGTCQYAAIELTEERRRVKAIL